MTVRKDEINKKFRKLFVSLYYLLNNENLKSENRIKFGMGLQEAINRFWELVNFLGFKFESQDIGIINKLKKRLKDTHLIEVVCPYCNTEIFGKKEQEAGSE